MKLVVLAADFSDKTSLLCFPSWRACKKLRTGLAMRVTTGQCPEENNTWQHKPGISYWTETTYQPLTGVESTARLEMRYDSALEPNTEVLRKCFFL